MDSKDSRIFQYLLEHGRDKISDISKTLDIPRVTVYERIQGMVRDGIIQKFTIIPDYKAIGLPVVSFIFVAFNPNADVTQRQLADKISKFREVEEVYIVTGEWDMLVKVRLQSVEEVGNFVLDKLRGIRGVEKTETIAVFSVVK
ncbi:MAG: Lrp/AsnC family transcriptional regulator [Candidatus Thermoplasmatota archaeon]|jgi:DNA-binding Lrp family transcriptional regulator|nr:Lrp/AsnC family transcriptional regulator [Candidatus Thermoplasmatota archaeon]MDA8144273.1 Lrp/AsnC family transcriptional regulator [Thermoplasmatales archaeon]